MRALQLMADRDIQLNEIEPPADPAPGEVQVAIRAVALNHIDVWGWRGMAFAKRKFPIVIGAEAAGEIVATANDVAGLNVGDTVALYGAQTCATCDACASGRDNLCENVGGIHGFHLDGFARERINVKARLCVKAPAGVAIVDAACASVTYGTVQHMLFDNARLKSGEWVLIQAGGSGIGSAAIQLAKAVGATVVTTVGSEEKAEKARALGADHVINYRDKRFETITRRLTGKKGVDVVFEHTGADTWNGSLLCLKRGGRLVTCGATTGASATLNLMQLFQQQYRIFGSFGCTIRNISEALDKMAIGDARPVIDQQIAMENVEAGLQRLEDRQVFGKIVLSI